MAATYKRVVFEKKHWKVRLAQRDHNFTGISRLFRPTFSLKTRVAISVVALVLATAILIGLVSLTLVERGMKEVISAQQSSLLTHAADEIDRQFSRRHASLHSLSAALSASIAQQSSKDPGRLQRYLEQHAGLTSQFDSLFIFDARGKLAAYVNRSDLPDDVDLATRDYLHQALRTPHGIVSAPLRDGLTQTLVVSLSTAILDRQGLPGLVVLGLVDLERDDFIGQLTHTTIGQTGYFYVVTADGTIIAHPDKSRVLQKVAAPYGPQPAFAQVLSEFGGTAGGSDGRTANDLRSFKRLRSTDWIIGAVSPEAEILAPIAQIKQRAMLAVALLMSMTGLLAWWMTRRQIAALQVLRDRILAAHGDTVQVVAPLRYRQDEIGDLNQAFDRLLNERLLAEAKIHLGEAELRAATDSSLDAFFILHVVRDGEGMVVDFRFRYLNANAERLIGMTQQQATGMRLCQLLPVMRTAGLFDKYVQVFESAAPMQEEFQIETPEIRAQWLHNQVVPLADGVAITMRNISARKRDEEELRDNRAFLQTLIDYLPVVVFAKSFRAKSHDQLVVWNKTAEIVMGYPADKVIGKNNLEIFPPNVAASLNVLDRQMRANPKVTVTSEFPYRRPDGMLSYLHSVSVPLLDENGEVEYILGIVEDVTARKRQEQALRKSERWLRTITDNLPALIAYVDREERYRFCNSYYETVFASEPGQVLGRTARDVLGERAYAFAADRIAMALQGERVTFEREHMEAGGNTRHWRVEYIPDRQDEKVAGFYAMVLDITELKQIENQLRTLARLDSLTGLANRHHFNEKLTEAMVRTKRSGAQMALLYLDIDNFKSINDSLGHHGGDAVLREFSQRLTACIRQSDTVARLAGDEFVIILEGRDMAAETVFVADKIMHYMKSGFAILGTERAVTTSIGIAIRREGEVDAEALLRRADEALYDAKSAGRQTFKIVS